MYAAKMIKDDYSDLYSAKIYVEMHNFYIKQNHSQVNNI